MSEGSEQEEGITGTHGGNVKTILFITISGEKKVILLILPSWEHETCSLGTSDVPVRSFQP